MTIAAFNLFLLAIVFRKELEKGLLIRIILLSLAIIILGIFVGV